MKQFLNTMYFDAVNDPETGKAVSRYQGTVVAFTIRRDDGTEFEVRDQESTAYGINRPLKKGDLDKLTTGTLVALNSNASKVLEVLKVFPQYGDVWVRDREADQNKVVKFHQLRRV